MSDKNNANEVPVGENTEPVANEEPAVETLVPEQTPTENAGSAKEKPSFGAFISHLKPIHYVLSVLILALVAGAAFVLGNSGDKAATEEPTADVDIAEEGEATDQDVDVKEEEIKEEEENDPILGSSVTWLAKPVEVTDIPVYDQAVFNAFYTKLVGDYGYGLDQKSLDGYFTSVKLGESSKQTIHVNNVVYGFGLGDLVARFITATDKETGQVTVYSVHSEGLFGEISGEYNGPEFIKEVAIDQSATIPSISYTDTLTYSGVTAERISEWFFRDDFDVDGLQYQRIDTSSDDVIEAGKTQFGTIFEVINPIESVSGVKSYQIILELPNGARVTYRHATDLLRDDNSIPISWDDGSSSEDSWRWDLVSSGCGSVSSVLVLDKQYHKDLKKIGSSNGQDVMTLNKASHPAIGSLYKASLQGFNKELTQTEFYEDKAVIVIRNELGFYVVLNNEKYQRAAECAKPVIYLYPEQPTFVSVAVGAEVTKSEPLYNGGWDVLALPNGSIVSGSGVYDSLFWDGIGYGEYPEITAGNFVERANVEQAMRDDMAYMGLNDKEINDFIEYWMPLMPDSEYVRLTWFTTEEMNQLAPLELSFTPDSMLRVFLDFEGVDTPFELTEQTLPQFERTGFSLIEWGGLRIGSE